MVYDKNREQRYLFERVVIIQGKHAYINKQLQAIGLFDSNREAAEMAMVLGMIFEQKEKVDTSEQYREYSYKIQKETMRDSGDKIRDLYRICMMLDSTYIDKEERWKMAFTYDERGEEAKEYEEVLESYMRGGFSIMDEKILHGGVPRDGKRTIVDYIRNEYDLMDEIEEKMKKKLKLLQGNQPLSQKAILELAD